MMTSFAKKKPLRRRFLETILRIMAQAVLRRHKPIIVGVTGSVGKSSTKEAIALVLALRFEVRKSEGNYNNELGIPLTIIDAQSGGKSLLAWMSIIVAWAKALFFDENYPEVLVLEMAVDRPGDMAYLMGFVPVRIGVMTNVSSSHLEFFGTVSRIAREKGIILSHLPPDGVAVVCADDPLVMKSAQKSKAKICTFGLHENASIRAVNVTISKNAQDFDGCRFKVCLDGKIIPVHLPHIIATHQVQAVLAAIAVGSTLKIQTLEMIQCLRTLRPIAGRLQLLEGLKQSVLLDDTYNASPSSLRAALRTLCELHSPGRSVAILGDMLELGHDSEREHRLVGALLREMKVDCAILVGRRMLVAYEELLKSGFSKKECFWFDTPDDAGKAARQHISAGDRILIKGSRGMRMEKVTEALMAHPEDAAVRLCCQSAEWKRKPFSMQ